MPVELPVFASEFGRPLSGVSIRAVNDPAALHAATGIDPAGGTVLRAASADGCHRAHRADGDRTRSGQPARGGRWAALRPPAPVRRGPQQRAGSLCDLISLLISDASRPRPADHLARPHPADLHPVRQPLPGDGRLPRPCRLRSGLREPRTAGATRSTSTSPTPTACR